MKSITERILLINAVLFVVIAAGSTILYAISAITQDNLLEALKITAIVLAIETIAGILISTLSQKGK